MLSYYFFYTTQIQIILFFKEIIYYKNKLASLMPFKKTSQSGFIIIDTRTASVFYSHIGCKLGYRCFFYFFFPYLNSKKLMDSLIRFFNSFRSMSESFLM